MLKLLSIIRLVTRHSLAKMKFESLRDMLAVLCAVYGWRSVWRGGGRNELVNNGDKSVISVRACVHLQITHLVTRLRCYCRVALTKSQGQRTFRKVTFISAVF